MNSKSILLKIVASGAMILALTSCLKKPDLGFTADIQKSGTVVFTNTSSYTNTYAWDFGDGTYSDERFPTHTYMANGSYTVTLTGSNKSNWGGKTNTSVVSKTINVQSISRLTATVRSSSFVASGYNISGNNYSSDIYFSAASNAGTGEQIYIHMRSAPALNTPMDMSTGDLDFQYHEAYSASSYYIASYSTLGSSGTITLTRNDSNIISGSFEFLGIKAGTDSIRVTGGNFTVAF